MCCRRRGPRETAVLTTVSLRLALLVITALALAVLATACSRPRNSSSSSPPSSTLSASTTLGRVISLPPPQTEGGLPLHTALAERRSVRTYTQEGLTTAEIGQLLWASQGQTQEAGGRTAPSAGGRYPLELYAVVGTATDELTPGLYRYLPARHGLEARAEGADLRRALSRAALGQAWVAQAPVVIVVSGVCARTEVVYGERAPQYMILEAGHAAQNLLLEAVCLGLGAVPVGAFDDSEVRSVLGMHTAETPLYLIPVGHVAGAGD